MADRAPRPPFRNTPGDDLPDHTQEFAFADVGPDGLLQYVSPFGEARWGWHSGQEVPDEMRFMLSELEPGSSRELPFLQGGLLVNGIRRAGDDGWMIVGYEHHGRADATGAEPLDTMIRDMPVSAVRMQPDGTVVYVNPETVRMTGYPLDEITGFRFWSRVIVEDDLGTFEDALRRVTPDAGVQTRFAYRTADGAVQHVTMHLFLTEAYFVEAVVLDRPGDSDDDLLLRAAAGTHGRGARGGTLLATVTHEIRSPLGAIRGYADLLRRELADLDSADVTVPDSVREFVSVIDDRSRRLADLVRDLAELSALQQGQVMAERVPVRLHTVILDAAHRAEPRIERSGRELSLRLEGDPRVLTDGYRLARVMDRVLGTAIAADDGRITIRAGEGGESATIEVQVDAAAAIGNDGAWLPAPNGGTASSERPGQAASLDLAMVELVMDLLEGSIAVEQQDSGSTVYRLSLPSVPEPVSAA